MTDGRRGERSDPLLVSLDIGTGSVRAHVLSVDGELRVSAARPVHVTVGADTRAEVDADHLWTLTLAVLREALEGVTPSRIAGLGVASALGYFLLGRDGAPLGPAMLWMDRRAGEEALQLNHMLDADALYRTVGRNVDPEVFLAKLLWVRDHEPDRFHRMACFIGVKDEIIRRLTGVIGSDPTHASYSLLFDVTRRAWSGDVMQAVGVPTAIVPALRKATDIAGRVTAESARLSGLPEGLPVVTCASDGTVGCVAAGIAAVGTGVNVTGTSDVLMTSVRQPALDVKRRTFLNPHPVSDGWMVGGILGTTGGALKWFLEGICGASGSAADFAKLEQAAGQAGVGARGLVALVGLTGERAPLWDPRARGVLCGLDLLHGRGEIARAIFEGVALSVRGVAEVLSEIGAGLSAIRVAGGGAASDVWNQIRADATGLRVERPRVTEGTAIGTALLTGLGVGIYSDLGEAARTIAPVERVYEPDADRHALYDRLAEVRGRLFANLQGTFPVLADFRASATSGAAGNEP